MFNWCKKKSLRRIPLTHGYIKPFGEVCTANGGLKEAHDIEWVNDPDDDCAMTNSKSAGNKQSFINFTMIRQELTTSVVHPNYFGCIWCHHTRPELCQCQWHWWCCVS